jgi:hypothetical protein
MRHQTRDLLCTDARHFPAPCAAPAASHSDCFTTMTHRRDTLVVHETTSGLGGGHPELEKTSLALRRQ